jgi:predicted lactoylglutathione lyase
MYGWSSYNGDGHHWEVLHMDVSAAAPAAAN